MNLDRKLLSGDHEPPGKPRPSRGGGKRMAESPCFEPSDGRIRDVTDKEEMR
jgi:hypothetical protein